MRLAHLGAGSPAAPPQVLRSPKSPAKPYFFGLSPRDIGGAFTLNHNLCPLIVTALGVHCIKSPAADNDCLREPTALEMSIARTLAALSATNEAILYAKSPGDLYRQVCEAAFSSGEFLATAVFLLEPETNMLRLAAGFGEDIIRLR